MKYKIYAGLGGSFGGATYRETQEYDTQDEADRDAYQLACEEYEIYDGLHGLRNVEQIMEDEEITEEEASEEWIEERESWLDYYSEKE